jgi:hypothetical protein
VNAPSDYYTLLVSRLLLLLVSCALTGCWEEIPYDGPPPGSSSASKLPAEEAKPEASEIAEDSAEPLATGTEVKPTSETASAAGESPTTPQPPQPAQPPHADTVETDDTLFGEFSSDVQPAATAEPIAPPAEPPARQLSPPVAKPALNTRRMAWLLGSKLSLAALANDRGAPAEDVADWFHQSRRLAKLLDTSVAELPPRPPAVDTAAPPDRALEYLFAQGQQIGQELGSRRGDDHAALFELAVKSNILLAMYRPNASVVGALAAAIEQASGRAELPAPLTQPLLNKLSSGASQAEVRDAVFQLHADVDRYLSTTP